MNITKIYSTRGSNTEVYSALIYEWEDELSKKLNIPIYSYNKNKDTGVRYFFRLAQELKIGGLLQRLEALKKKSKDYILVYELYPRKYFSHQVFSDKIPFIIDFDYNVPLETFYRIYGNCKLVIISSLQAYNYLKENNCPLNIEHVPLSLSDKFKLSRKPSREKKYDLFIARQNKKIMEFVERYAEEHPDFEYVIRQWVDGELYKNNVYVSNKRGALGEFSDRSEYFQLLQDTRVATYSTPGYDETDKRFMNHVTPSLFEFVVNGCRIMARYPKNAETDYYDLSSFAESSDSYEDFKNRLTYFLEDQSSDYLVQYEKFLDKVYTSRQIQILKNILNKY